MADELRLDRLMRDERGQAATEYLLVCIGVVLPFALLMPLLYRMIYLYFHRISGVVSLPFP